MSGEEFEFVPVVNFLFEISYPSLIILLPLQIRKCKKKKNIRIRYEYISSVYLRAYLWRTWRKAQILSYPILTILIVIENFPQLRSQLQNTAIITCNRHRFKYLTNVDTFPHRRVINRSLGRRIIIFSYLSTRPMIHLPYVVSSNEKRKLAGESGCER